jgi:hypothetical protein
MTGNYGPAAAGAAVRNCNNPYARTVYIGGFPEGQSKQLCDGVLSLTGRNRCRPSPQSRPFRPT